MTTLSFSTILKSLLDSQSLTQSQLATLLGIRQSQISNWLTGKSLPNYHNIRKLCHTFNCSADSLVGT